MAPYKTVAAALLLAQAGTTLSQNVFNWDCTNSLMTCNNACYEVNCKGGSASYTYDPDNSAAQRTASGCDENPCNNDDLKYGESGDSCDEFPFASTVEGGTGSSLRCVPQSDNDSEGGQLSNFYGNLNAGDTFTISVENYIGAPYCEDANFCDNDGYQFIWNNGQFVDNKLRRAHARQISSPAPPARRGQFEDSVGTVSGAPFRKFLGEDGAERLWLSKNTSDTLVGKTVFSEGKGEIKIVKEIV